LRKRWRGNDDAATPEQASKSRRLAKPAAALRETCTQEDLNRKIWDFLLQGAADLGEFAGEVDTEGVDDRDNGERDEGCDQTIFNGGGAGFISQEFEKNSLQFASFQVAREVPRCEFMALQNLRLRKFRLVNS
jgi:hypothetical protein